MQSEILFVNFGGPRSLQEIEPFLIALLTDPEVIRPRLPLFFHNWFFTRVAKKRVKKAEKEYRLIGGKSPIYEDTEWIAQEVGVRLQREVRTFHRYLPETHETFLCGIESEEVKTIFPLFPQFTYATTGSIARFFETHLDSKVLCGLRWVKSYAKHPAYIDCMQRSIREFMLEKDIEEQDVLLLFSAHGLPQTFVDSGDIYEKECRGSYLAITKNFPQALSLLSYQSKFGRGEWLKPYTDEVCRNITSFSEGRKNVVVVPLSFTSDHIETLFEIEYQYLPLIKNTGLRAFRCPALNRRSDWLSAICAIIADADLVANDSLLRP